MKGTVVLIFALTAFWGVAAGADYFDGLAAFKRGDYEAAIEEWKPLAEQGFPEAQYQLARMYHRGYAVQDDAEAARLYRLAAEQDHVMAHNNLGVLYEQGRGVERDEATAARWYLTAAQNGLTVAQANLAVLYDEGRGVEASGERAAHWYRMAGDSGHATSQYRMARLLEQGRGVEQNEHKAAGWYRKAAKQDHAESQLALARMYEEGRGVKRDPSKAAKWRRMATMQGLEATRPEPRAAHPGTEPAATTAEVAPAPEPRELPEMASEGAEAGEPPAAPAAETVSVVPPAAPATDPSSVEPPAAPAAETEPVEPPAPLPPPAEDQLAPAMAAIFDAAEAGDVDAQYKLARRYESGDGLPLSHKEAGKWYLAAAERGHGLAGYKVAFQYFRGRGVARGKDLVRAHFWFSVSADRGVGDAAAWRETIKKKLNKRQLAESEALLAEWNRR